MDRVYQAYVGVKIGEPRDPARVIVRPEPYTWVSLVDWVRSFFYVPEESAAEVLREVDLSRETGLSVAAEFRLRGVQKTLMYFTPRTAGVIPNGASLAEHEKGLMEATHVFAHAPAVAGVCEVFAADYTALIDLGVPRDEHGRFKMMRFYTYFSLHDMVFHINRDFSDQGPAYIPWGWVPELCSLDGVEYLEQAMWKRYRINDLLYTPLWARDEELPTAERFAKAISSDLDHPLSTTWVLF